MLFSIFKNLACYCHTLISSNLHCAEKQSNAQEIHYCHQNNHSSNYTVSIFLPLSNKTLTQTTKLKLCGQKKNSTKSMNGLNFVATRDRLHGEKVSSKTYERVIRLF